MAQAGMELPKAVVRVGEQAIWSTWQYANAAAVANTNNRVFTTPQGMVGQGFGAALTIAETNLKEGGRIPGGQAYDVYGVTCYPHYPTQAPIVSDDVRDVIDNLVLAWDFLQTLIEIAPAQLIGAGGGIFGATADTGANDGGNGSRILANNGNGQLWIYRRFPVMLSANSTYAIVQRWGGNAGVIDGGPTNAAMNVRIGLLGEYKTAIAVA